jgi:hypothetical protein
VNFCFFGLVKGRIWFRLIFIKVLGSVEDWIWFRLIFIKVLGSVVITSVFTLALMPQPPMGHKRVTPWNPALAHASLACFAGSLTHRFG